MSPSPHSGDLPDDLAHPRRDTASLIANLATAGALLAILGVLATGATFMLR